MAETSIHLVLSREDCELLRGALARERRLCGRGDPRWQRCDDLIVAVAGALGRLEETARFGTVREVAEKPAGQLPQGSGA